jgi:hypothetical protein
MPHACGGLLSFFASLPNISGSTLRCDKKGPKKGTGKDYTPFTGSSPVDQLYIVISGSVPWCCTRIGGDFLVDKLVN